MCTHRIKQVDSDQADEDIESAFGLQLEQLILQGKSELDLIPMMAGCHALPKQRSAGCQVPKPSL